MAVGNLNAAARRANSLVFNPAFGDSFLSVEA